MNEPTLPFDVVRVAHIESRTVTPTWLVESLWGEQAVGFIGGTPKSCKTWLSLELAVAVATGNRCLGRFEVHDPGPVLLYAAEDSATAIRRRVTALAQARHVDLDRLAVGLITEPVLQLDREEHQRRLEATLARVKPRLMVLDPLVRLHRGDENSAADTSDLLAFLRGLQREHGVAIAVVHHVRKAASGGQPGQALRGSGDLHAWSDSNLFLLHRSGRLELHAEHREHPAPMPMAVQLATGPEHLVVGPTTTGPREHGTSALHQKILDTLRTSPKTRTSLREHLRIRNETLGSALADLEASGQIERRGTTLVVPRSQP